MATMGRHYKTLTFQEAAILRMLQRAKGPVTRRIIELELWGRYGKPLPTNVHPYIANIRRVTGLGIVGRLDAGWLLVPELNATWCESEKWNDVPRE